ncbi:16S rRNA (guanine(527)-N(7))-methyltransferase RsmG [Clostridium paridis]|uniref:Ribosomal RNA small subunit methyltransferase G n=1 Tax=Clostridium paridis TaxID=2803863 RepID=A0A937K3H8_9CLOT|nr:16S rRNA (guanine(527)-N(7))-methyltransferase RsmG [Clostridium paridis]MBL4930493.1 16S rRNA (guanine(527)-N(7))-methyltransferase RsmG [Clostridium paridis]
MDLFELMKNACEEVDLVLTEEKYNQFQLYRKLLQEWNEKINLTAIVEEEEIIKKHFIDSIKIFKSEELRNSKSIIDVGTGAGFPGLPIAIMDSNIQVTLLDSLNKRILFLNEVVSKLNLKNVKTIHSRAEDGARNKLLREKFDVAVSRAVANMSVLSEYCMPYVRVGGNFIALKGPSIDEELIDAKNAIGTLGGVLKNVVSVKVDGTDLNHNLVIVSKTSSTSAIYPRKAGTITKKPIK